VELKAAVTRDLSSGADIQLWPEDTVLETVINQLNQLIAFENSQKVMWTQRIAALRELNEDMKPIRATRHSRTDSYAPHFISIGSESKFSGQTSCFNLLQDAQSNLELKFALKPLNGKESTLLPKTSAVGVCLQKVLSLPPAS
jgi:hypothetical protein